MADELLDLVDKNDKVIGTVWKSKAHGNPKLIHREISIGIFNNKGEVLLQQRSMQKSSPGSWKISAAGHVASGENPELAVIREVEEELGLKIEPVYFSKMFDEDSTHMESKFYWVYYALVNGRPKLKLDKDEVMDTRWVKIDEIKGFSRNNDFSLISSSYKMIMKISKHLNQITG